MSREICLAFVVAMIAGTILSTEVDAQSTVDDSASCESSAFDEAVNIIREDLKDVKNLFGSNQQQNDASSISKKDFEDLKAPCDASSRQQNNASSSFNEVLSLIREDLKDVKNLLLSSIQQRNNVSSSLSETVNLIREDLEDVKNLLASTQQQNNATGIPKTACASNQQ